MAYKVTTRKSYGSRILNSFVGVLIGIALIIGMSILLFWNEGRFNLSKLAVDAQEITASNATTLNGQLVWYKGTLTGAPMTFDGVIEDASYIRLRSSVEVYAWIESSQTETRDNYGGSQTTETTYTYALGWTSNPQDPSTFQDPEFRSKPLAVAAVTAVDYKNPNVTTADFTVNINDLQIDGEAALPLNATTVKTLTDDKVISNNFIYYKASGSTGPSTPILGDTMVFYTYLPETVEGVLVGRASGTSIVKFTNEDGSLYRMFQVSTLEEVVAQLDSEHKASTWMLRLIGTILMCIGFALLTGPFSTLLMVVPFLGNASKFLLGIVSFLIGFVYSFIVIVLSAIIHNPIALVIAIGIVIFAVYMGYKKSKEKKLSKAKK